MLKEEVAKVDEQAHREHNFAKQVGEL